MDAAYGGFEDASLPVGGLCEACGGQLHTVEWLTEERTAELMHVQPHTLANWRALGKGPTYSKAGRNVLYARCFVDRYLLG